MKKIIVTLLFLSSIIFVKAQAPSLRTAMTPTIVVDTLHYYLNKYYFKTANTDYTTYRYYRTDASAINTFTDISLCGSRFDVPPGETVFVTGLEAYVGKDAIYVNQAIPIHIYLCKLDPLSGMPVLPPIDSVSTAIRGSGAIPQPSLVGGDFTSTLTIAARTMTSSFAVLVKNFSGAPGDYTHFLRTPCNTNTSTAGTDKYGDGYGFVRFNRQFYSTKDFNLFPGFGVGTDYEFMVAPRVSYSIQAGSLLPAGVVVNGSTEVPDIMCTRNILTFTNTSSAFYEHRQYNLNQFYRKWSLGVPFPSSVLGAFTSDSSITWHFEFYDRAQPTRDSRVFLPYVNNGTISAVTDLVSDPDPCFTANQFRARLKPMGAFGRVQQLIYNEDFTVCFKYCNGDTLGIKSMGYLPALKVYPNPAMNGRTQITGLEGKNTVTLSNILGQTITAASSENNAVEVDLANQPKGTYLIRITNSQGQSKVVKVVNQD